MRFFRKCLMFRWSTPFTDFVKENECNAYCCCWNPRARGNHLAIQILLVTAWLLVTRVCFIYLGDVFFFFSWYSWTKWARWVNLKFYLSLSGFNQVEWGREMSPRFPFPTPGVWELPLRPTVSEVAKLIIYLFRILFSMKPVFFIKVHVKVFYIQVRFKCEIPPLLSTEKTLYRKNYIFFCRLCKN